MLILKMYTILRMLVHSWKEQWVIWTDSDRTFPKVLLLTAVERVALEMDHVLGWVDLVGGVSILQSRWRLSLLPVVILLNLASRLGHDVIEHARRVKQIAFADRASFILHSFKIKSVRTRFQLQIPRLLQRKLSGNIRSNCFPFFHHLTYINWIIYTYK